MRVILCLILCFVMGASLQVKAVTVQDSLWLFSNENNWVDGEEVLTDPIEAAFLILTGSHSILGIYEFDNYDGIFTEKGKVALVEINQIQANIPDNNSENADNQATDNEDSDEDTSLDPDEPTNEENSGISQPRNGFGPGVFFPNPNSDPPCNNDLCQ